MSDLTKDKRNQWTTSRRGVLKAAVVGAAGVALRLGVPPGVAQAANQQESDGVPDLSSCDVAIVGGGGRGLLPGLSTGYGDGRGPAAGLTAQIVCSPTRPTSTSAYSSTRGALEGVCSRPKCRALTPTNRVPVERANRTQSLADSASHVPCTSSGTRQSTSA